MITGRTVLIATEMLAASVWVGSLVCLALVSNVARRVLDGPSRVALFRGIGRLYGRVGTGALLITIAAGVAIAGRPSNWETTVSLAIILSAVLVALTLIGMAQARRMTVHRNAHLTRRDVSIASRIDRGAAVAGALRGSLVLVTLVILVLGAHVVGAYLSCPTEKLPAKGHHVMERPPIDYAHIVPEALREMIGLEQVSAPAGLNHYYSNWSRCGPRRSMAVHDASRCTRRTPAGR